MLEANVNMLDAIIIGVFALSVLVGFLRGFMREVLSLGAWVAAGAVTLYAFPHVAEWLKPKIGHEMVASGIAALGTYVSTLIGLSVLNMMLLRYVKAGSDVGMVDNALGLAFGALRGAFIISLGFLLLTAVMDKDHYPEWVETAWTKPYAEEGAHALAKLAPGYLEEMSGFAKLKPEEEPEEESSDSAPVSKPIEAMDEQGSGYSADARARLRRLLDAEPEGSTTNLPETIEDTEPAAPIRYR
jgi:membrane protein required for colicin V production